MPMRSGDKLRFAAVVVAIFALLMGAKLALSLGAGETLRGVDVGLSVRAEVRARARRPPGRHKCDTDQDCPSGQGCALILSAVGDTDRVTQICTER